MSAAQDGSLHILILSDRDWTHPQGGGTGTNLFGQVSRWIAWGHRVTIVACSYPGAASVERLGPLTIHRVGGRSTVFPRTIWRQWRGLVRDPDVVLEVINGVTFLTPLWLREPHVSLVHHIHRDHYVAEMGRKGRLAAFLLETAPLRFLYQGTRFLTISEATARAIEAHGVPRENIQVGYIGVELGAFQPEPRRRAEEPTLLYLGRLKRYKRIELVLDALAATPDAVLELAGDGDHRPALEEEIRARGLAGRVRMHGHVTEAEKLELLQRSWVNLTASSAEGWCLTVMEAAACETPTAALDVGGLPESIEHGVTGLLARDTQELGAHTRRLVEDRELRERLGRAARERALEFTWERTAAASLELLKGEVVRAADRLVPSMNGQPDEALAGLEAVEGWLTDAQALRLWERAHPLEPGARIVEIGSYRGRSAIVLARAAPPGVELTAIDPHAGNDRGPRQLRGSSEEGEEDLRVFRENLARAGVAERVRHVRRPSESALGDVEGAVDLLYVDGAHRYSRALHDLVEWGGRVRPGGRLLVHDAFSSVGVTLAIARALLLGGRFHYEGRTGSLADYRRTDLVGLQRVPNALRQLAQLPWFARNLVVKALLVARLRPLARALGHRSGPWPY
jgi:glycosyltransferase involved in cell wall biosynthesis